MIQSKETTIHNLKEIFQSVQDGYLLSQYGEGEKGFFFSTFELSTDLVFMSDLIELLEDK